MAELRTGLDTGETDFPTAGGGAQPTSLPPGRPLALGDAFTPVTAQPAHGLPFFCSNSALTALFLPKGGCALGEDRVRAEYFPESR